MTWILDIGTELAGYRLTAELGRGGMGYVYEAEHLRLGRKAALKLLAPDLADDERFRERFIRESQLIAAIDHPNIIPIYDAGEIDGVLYIAMRYVDGYDLKKLIAREGRLPSERALSIVEQVASALDAAHARDLVHRDVKPGNVLVDEPTERVFLTDFGVAKDAKAGGETKAGALIGSIGYAPPEQLEGKPPGPATDVYALGCVLYECLAGKQPFDRETEVAAIYAHLLDPPPALTATRTDLPVAIDDVIATALAKSEGDRYPSCGDLLAAARSALGGAPAIAARPRRETVQLMPERRAERAVESNLPVQATPLVGREDELATACALLRRDDVRLETLTGSAGTGKTRLAAEVALSLLADFPDGVFFVELATIADPGLVPLRIAEALGVKEQAGESTLDALRARLSDEQLLLVLDNFEQLLPAAPLVADLLAAAPFLKVLVTSQAALHLRGEHECPVPPLALPDRDQAADPVSLSQCAAVVLFVERAQAVDPSFGLTAENAAALGEICVRLDGLPLAIELAAARAKLLSPHAMVTKLENRLQLLTAGARDLPSRHRTLRGAIDWSYELLLPDEQTLFARLAVFSGGCTLEAAEAVCGTADELEPQAIMDGLGSLVDKSLLRGRKGADGETRFDMLQTIHEYALYRLIERGEADDLRRRHARHYLAHAEAAEPELLGPGQAAWIKRLEEETGNVRAAMAWSLDSGDLEIGLRMAGALARFWSIRDQMTEGRRWLEQARERSGDVAKPVRAKALFAAGYLALGQGDYPDAIARFDESVALYRELEDAEGEGMCLAQLGWLFLTQGQLGLAKGCSEESVRLARELRDDRIASVALSNLAEIASREEEYARATELFAESLALRRKLGDRRNIANALLNLGRTEIVQGRYERAAPLIEEGLELAHEVRDTWSISVGLSALARLALHGGDHSRAKSLLADGLDSCRRRGDKRIAAECLQTLAGVVATGGEPARAARIWGAAEALREAIGTTLSPGERSLREEYVPVAREKLGVEAFRREWAEGRSLGLEEAISYAVETRPTDASASVARPVAT